MRIAVVLMFASGCTVEGTEKGPTGPYPTDPSLPTQTTPPPVTSPPTTTTAGSCSLDDPLPYAVGTDPACVGDPVLAAIVPVVEWTWSTNALEPGFDQVMSTPVVANLTDDDDDGDIDAYDVPDIVFTSFSGGAYSGAGAVSAISGDGGAMHWSVLDAGGFFPHATGGVAVGDLDGDGTPEVVVASTTGLLCLRADGSFAWHVATATSFVGMPAIADLEGDGTAEVVYGRTVVDHDGAVRWVGTDGTGSVFLTSYAVDLDGDGPLEVVAGNTVYESDGTVRWNDGSVDGVTAVADLDGDGAPEIVRSWWQMLSVAGADGSARWSVGWAPEEGGGPPTVADFDGDGAVEIGVVTAEHYRVFEADGTEKWAVPVQELTSGRSSAAAFDFDADGAAEVVHADEETVRILDGASGATLWELTGHSSGTLSEYPVLADVDRDASAEIVVASNDYAFPGSHGITVLGDPADAFGPARPVWNQHAYHVTNVEDDAGIPASPVPSWTASNTFRAADGPAPEEPPPWADWRVEEPVTCLDECPQGRVYAWFPVENEGATDGGAVDVVVTTAGGRTAWEATLVVPAGQGLFAGPVELGFQDLPVTAVVTGSSDCDPADNVAILAAWPCP